ncbi:MAG: InlB B-repeat-containing protein [Micrococcales bacterium]
MVLDANYVPSGGSSTYFDTVNNSVTVLATRTVEIDPRTYTVTFDKNSSSATGSMSTQSSNAPANLTANGFTNPGYSFVGWTTVADGTGTLYTNQQQYDFSASVTLYAKWSPLPRYSVTFHKNDENATGTMGVQTNYAQAALTANGFTNSGYTFIGWATNSNGTGTTYSDQQTYDFAADINLYAQWSALPSYTVVFDPNLGSGSMADQTNYAPAALVSNQFSREGFSFAYWTTAADGSGTRYNNGAQYSFSANVTLFANWTPLPRYTVIFNKNAQNAIGSMANQTNYQQSSLSSVNFTYPGHTFVRWSTNPDGSGSSYNNGDLYAFTSNATLYAQWNTLPSYTVTFAKNDLGATGFMASQTNNFAQNLNFVAYAKSGATFLYWSTNQDGTGATYNNGAEYPFTENVTLYAQWQDLPRYAVTFDKNSISATGSMVSQTYYAPLALNANAYSWPRHTFVGWNSQPDGSGTPYLDRAIYSFDANVTLYAQWVDELFTVRFHKNNASATGVMADQVSNVDGPLTSNGFQLVGHHFLGWSLNAVYGSVISFYDGDQYRFDTDADLYAIWEADQYTVTFDPNGNGDSPTNVGYTYGSNPMSLPVVNRQHYDLLGWFDSQGQKIGDPGDSLTPTGDIAYYAHWSPHVYTVNFYKNSSAATGTMVSQRASSAQNLSQVTFQRQGHTFAGWALSNSSSSTVFNDGDTFDFQSDIDLYALWTPETYKVTYDRNGNGDFNLEVNYIFGSAPLELIEATWPGHVFLGWYDDPIEGNLVGNQSDLLTPTADITLYAHWSESAFEVKFFKNSDEAIGTMSRQLGSSAARLRLNSFSRFGYEFAGWSTETGATVVEYLDNDQYDFARDMNLYAIWTPKRFQVDFDPNGNGDPVETQHFTYGSNPLTMPSPTWAHHVFVGWYSAENGFVGTGGDSISPTENKTYFAHWRNEIVYRVQFDSNSGNGEATHPEITQSSENSSVTLSNRGTIERYGYSFQGWALSPTATEAEFDELDDYLPTEDVTFYAVWRQIFQNISGNVFFDYNEDGVQQSDEPFLPGLPVSVESLTTPAKLHTSAFRAASFYSFTTNENGGYSISSLPIGSWKVTATLPSILNATSDSDGNADAQVIATLNPGTDANTWVGVEGHSNINASVFDKDGHSITTDIVLEWEGLDGELLNADDVDFRFDPNAGKIIINNLPSGNYRIVRLGATSAQNQCSRIRLTENQTFTTAIHTQPGYSCQASVTPPNLASTGTDSAVINREVVLGILSILGGAMAVTVSRRIRRKYGATSKVR